MRQLPSIILFVVALLGSAGAAAAAEPVAQLRLYALDCGDMYTKNKNFFSDTFDYDGQTNAGVSPCFVIRHPKGTLLWNTGIGDEIAALKDGGMLGTLFAVRLKQTLASQLQQIGLAPADIDFVAFSHFHGDHTGNAKNYPGATWIVNQAEVDAIRANPPIVFANDAFKNALAAARQQVIRGDHDVFGDGTVRILKTPGHTPGHQSLLLQLPKTGWVLLSGDLYHLRANRQYHRVPGGNYSRADTMASFDRIDTIAKNRNARLVIEHDTEDFAELPKPPAYLD